MNERVRIVRLRAAVLRAVGTNQPARHGDAGARTLAGDAVVRHGTGQVDDGSRERARPVGDDARNLCRRRVITELELVRRPIRQDALQIEDRVARTCFGVYNTAGHAVGRVAHTLVVKDADVARPAVVHLDIEAAAGGSFGHDLRRLKLRDVEIRVR